MFQKIIDFFRSLFGFSKSSVTNNEDDTIQTNNEASSDINLEEDAQDASEIKPDTVIVTYEPDPILDLPDTTPVTETTTTTETTTPPVTDTPTDTPTEPVEEPPVEENQPTENTPVAESHKPRYFWCLDNGHGKKTAGKRSPKFPDGSQFMEYEFNRDVVNRIIKALDQQGVKTFNVVPEVDIDNFLEGRVKRANNKKSDLPKIFVSVHANAAPARPGKWAADSISGIETWCYHGNKKGRKVASIFQKHLVAQTGWKNRFVKSQASKQFYVLRKTNMTAILTENGFYNNERECKELMKDSVRQKIADAHVDAIMEIEKNGII